MQANHTMLVACIAVILTRCVYQTEANNKHLINGIERLLTAYTAYVLSHLFMKRSANTEQTKVLHSRRY